MVNVHLLVGKVGDVTGQDEFTYLAWYSICIFCSDLTSVDILPDADCIYSVDGVLRSEKERDPCVNDLVHIE
jgi:hypothetical protein